MLVAFLCVDVVATVTADHLPQECGFFKFVGKKIEYLHTIPRSIVILSNCVLMPVS